MFDAWMHDLSDQIQHVAIAYGERFSAEEMWRVINETKDSGLRYVLSASLRLCEKSLCDGGGRNILHVLLHTALLQIIHTNQWFLSSPSISYTKSTHTISTQTYHNKIKELTGQVFNVLEAWGVPEEITRDTPLAGDWESFNKGDNRGEVVQGAGVLGVVNFAKL